MLPNEDNVPIVDNHDLQRSFARPNVREGTNFRSPRQMKLANAFMLAWPYGTPKVMSSYDWPVKMTAPMVDQNVWYGPPHDENDIYIIKHVTTNDDASCGNGWICEHRYGDFYIFYFPIFSFTFPDFSITFHLRSFHFRFSLKKFR